MPTIVLVRHGETHWNKVRRIQGLTDSISPLTLKGIAQAQAYGRTIRRLMGDDQDWRVISSPLARCVQTAAILCETAGLAFDQVQFDLRLREVDTGAYSGLVFTELKRDNPDFMRGRGRDAWFFRCPDGENHDDMVTRLSQWLGECRKGDKLVVVSHGVTGKMLRTVYGDLDVAAVLAEDAPQDALFVMSEGKITRLACDDDICITQPE